MSPRVAEVLAGSDLDWLVIDMEHSPIGFAEVEAVIRAIDRTDTTPLIRLPELESVRGAAKRALDSGARGVIVPRIESAEAAYRVVQAARFPPDGDRGMAGSVRASGYGRSFEQFHSSANSDILVFVMIETATGVNRAEAILTVDGVDGVFIGENDLSVSYGEPGEKDLPAVQEGVKTVQNVAETADVYTGLVAGDPQRLERRRSEKFDLISIGSDLSLLSVAVTDRLST